MYYCLYLLNQTWHIIALHLIGIVVNSVSYFSFVQQYRNQNSANLQSMMFICFFLNIMFFWAHGQKCHAGSNILNSTFLLNIHDLTPPTFLLLFSLKYFKFHSIFTYWQIHVHSSSKLLFKDNDLIFTCMYIPILYVIKYTLILPSVIFYQPLYIFLYLSTGNVNILYIIEPYGPLIQ